MKTVYNTNFYETRDESTSYFAHRLATIIANIFSPSSAVDLGCGVGTVLRHLQMTGCSEILGVEGSWLNTSQLVIQESEFCHGDLTRPFIFNRRFDIAISLEVAEHIDGACADTFVDSLCSLSTKIIFSAAIPYQGGMHHVNERWQSYWASKFAERGYKAFDIIRPFVWNDKRIPTYYRQNSIAYLQDNFVVNNPVVSGHEVKDTGYLDRVHPDQYLAQVKNPMNVSYMQLLRYFPRATLAAIDRVAKRMIGH